MTKLVLVREIVLNTSVSNHTITITREVTHTHYEMSKTKTDPSSVQHKHTFSKTQTLNSGSSSYAPSGWAQICLTHTPSLVTKWSVRV